MGGNAAARYKSTGTVKIVDGCLAYAERTNFDHVEDLNIFRNDVLQLLRGIETQAGVEFWKGNALEIGQFFFGSFRNLVQRVVTDERLLQVKFSVGDIDVAIPRGTMEALRITLDRFEEKSIDQTWQYVGPSSRGLSSKLHAIFSRTTKERKTFVQFDFEEISLENGAPPSVFVLMRSSPWRDIEVGLKGVAHKLLLASIVQEVSFNENRVVLTDKSPLTPIGKIRVKSLDEVPPAWSISEHGLREKLVEQKLHGVPVFVDGKRAFKEQPRSQSLFVSDTKEIFKKLFGRSPAGDEHDDMGCFVGLLGLCSKFFSQDRIARLYDRFVLRKLWGKGAQRLVRSADRDCEVKRRMIDVMQQRFPHLMDRLDIKRICAEYYEETGDWEIEE